MLAHQFREERHGEACAGFVARLNLHLEDAVETALLHVLNDAAFQIFAQRHAEGGRFRRIGRPRRCQVDAGEARVRREREPERASLAANAEPRFRRRRLPHLLKIFPPTRRARSSATTARSVRLSNGTTGRLWSVGINFASS